MSQGPRPDSSVDDAEELRERSIRDSLKVIDDHIERARQYHEQHGVWPPDPLLDEVDEMRRRIMAEHGNDWRKVLDHYVEVGKQHRERADRAPGPDPNDQSAA